MGKLGNSKTSPIFPFNRPPVPGSVSTVQLPIINDAMWPVAGRRVKVVAHVWVNVTHGLVARGREGHLS